MTAKEKKDNPEYKTTGGYLKVYEYQEAFKKSWDNADPEDRIRIKELPNFCAKKFKQISGIDVLEDIVEMTHEEIVEMTHEEIEKALGKKIKIKSN